MRTSPVHYIAPSSISVMPNANEKASDLAVYVARGAKIKVYSQGIAELGFTAGQAQTWTLSGRNRRLGDPASPYTIYARLHKTDRTKGYLVFAPKVQSDGGWLDKYPYVTLKGLATDTAGTATGDYWYVRLGDVSVPDGDSRTVTLDTGILGTDQFNTEWNLDPDDMPLRVIVSCTIDDEDAGPTPYVPWGGSILLHASLAEGWAMDSGAIVTRWSIVRNTGEGPDASWPDDARATHFSDTGDITLSHRRGSDDFGGAVSATFRVTAYGIATPGSGDVAELASAMVTIDAETGESFKLVLSSSVVSYDPDNDAYSPSAGIAVMIRTTDQRGNVSLLDAGQVAGLGLAAAYAVVDTGTWTPLPFSGSGDDPAVAVIPASVFSAHQGLTVRLTGASGEELDTEPVAFVTEGEGTVITGSSIAYAASEDGMTPPADDGADPTVDPDDVTVPDEITSAARTLLSSFASSVQVPTGGVTHAYVSKLLYEADRQYNAGASAYGLPVLYRKANFPNVMDYYGDRTDTSLAFSALTGWLAAMVLTEIRPDRRNDLMRIGYGLGPSKDVFIYRYDFRSDPNVARMVASAIYSAMRGRVRPSLQAMRAEVGRPTFNYSISAVSDGSYEDYKDTYYVDLRSFMPTAPGPYLPAYADRSAIGGVPYDAYDTADHNLQTDLDVYNIVVARYNLDNPSYRQRTVQAIANIELDPVHIFGDNVSTEHYTFHPAFGTDTIGRRIAPDGATATAFDKIGHVGLRNRYWLQDGAYYGRRRPGQGETDGSVKDAPYGVLMDFEIENGDGRGTGYDNEEEYEAAVRSKIYANSYPSGHSAHVFAGALFLMELFPSKADLILRAANQYSTDRQITRYHWLSDCIVGRLAGAAMSAVERGSTDYDSLLLAARTEQGGGTSESAWKPTIAETGIKDGLFLWTRRTTTYSDDRVPTVEYSVARWGVDGDGIAEIDSLYLATSDESLVIDSTTDVYPKPGDAGWAQAGTQAKWYATFGEAAAANGGVGAMQGWNVWEKTVIKYDAYNDDGTKKVVPDLVNYRCSRIGQDGQIGEEEYYMLAESDDFATVFGSLTPAYNKIGIRWYNQSNPAAERWRLSDTTPNINTQMWSAVRPTYNKDVHGKKVYLWNFEQRVDGTGTEYATRPVCIGNHARGIKGVIELYALSASQTPVSADRPIPADINSKNTWGAIPTSGFEDPQVWGDEKYERSPSEQLPYQWNWTRTLYSSKDADGKDYEDHYHVSAVRGTRGEDGAGIEFIYCRPQSHNADGTPITVAVPDPNILKDKDGVARTAEYIKTHDDFVPYQWTDNPVGIDFLHQIEYRAERKSSAVSGTGGFTGGHKWGLFSSAAVHSKWGKNGQDGDGVEYVYIRTATNSAPTITNSSDTYAGKTYLDDDYLPLSSAGRCTDDPQGTSHDLPYEWVIKRTKGAPDAETGVRQWEKYSGAMALWANFSESITKESESYRYATNNTGTRPAASSSDWKTTKPALQQGYWLYVEITITWSDNSTTVLYTEERNPNDGVTGQDIIVDGSTEMKYYVGDSNTTHPAESSSDWKDLSQVTQTQGKWLWSKATTYYRKSSSAAGSKDAGHSVNYNVSYISKDGIDGRAVTGITEYYKATSSNAEMPVPTTDSGWSTNPNVSNWGATDKYLWNYEKVTYSSGTTVERTKPQIVAIWTKDGTNGTNGRGIDSIVNYYKITSSATPPSKPSTDGGGGWDDDPTAPGAGEYLWNYEKVTYTDGSVFRSDVQLIGHVGTNGANGKDGTNGNGIVSITNKFALSTQGTTASETTAPTIVGSWSTTEPTPTDTYPYVWRREKTEYTDTTKNTTKYFLVAAKGKDGQPGQPGHTGRWYEYYGDYAEVGNVPISNTADHGWFIKRGSYFYMLIAGNGVSVYTSTAPTTATSNTNWEYMGGDRKYYIAQAFFGENAYLGSFIINGDWMISQFGVIYDTSGGAHDINSDTASWNGYNKGNAYTLFKASYPNSSRPGYNNFCPYFAVDGKTGKSYQNSAYVKGDIYATGGAIGGLTIYDNGQSFQGNMILRGQLALSNGNTNKASLINNSGAELWGNLVLGISSNGLMSDAYYNQNGKGMAIANSTPVWVAQNDITLPVWCPIGTIVFVIPLLRDITVRLANTNQMRIISGTGDLVTESNIGKTHAFYIKTDPITINGSTYYCWAEFYSA